MATERAEKELRQLITKAQKLPSKLDGDNVCIDWIDDEHRKAKKIFEQIERFQRQIPGMDAKLFNDSRDCCDLLKNWLKRLSDTRTRLLDNEDNQLVQTLDELGNTCDGFRRSRFIFCSK